MSGTKSLELTCPNCGDPARQAVRDSRKTSHGVRRRRQCAACGERWTSHEINSKNMAAYIQVRINNHIRQAMRKSIGPLIESIAEDIAGIEEEMPYD